MHTLRTFCKGEYPLKVLASAGLLGLFPQLKNLGFAITPEVRVTMRMTLLDSTGKDLHEKDYDSGVVSGSSYMISGRPVERVNKLAHEVVYDLMCRAASDVHVYQQSHPAVGAVH